MQPAKHNLEKPFYYADVSFVYFSILNWKDFACLINKVAQSNKIIMENDNAI